MRRDEGRIGRVSREVNSGVVRRCCLWAGLYVMPGCDCYTRVPTDDCGTDREPG